MIRSLISRRVKPNLNNIKLSQTTKLSCTVSEYFKPQSRQLTYQCKYNILQNAKRLQTFSVPQEEEIKPIDKEIFNDAALRTFIRIEEAFRRVLESELNQISRQKIKQINKKNIYSFEVLSDKGVFTFQAFEDLSTLYFTSPFTGVYKYYYSPQHQKFLNNKDHHILEECLTRQVLDKFNFVLEL